MLGSFLFYALGVARADDYLCALVAKVFGGELALSIVLLRDWQIVDELCLQVGRSFETIRAISRTKGLLTSLFSALRLIVIGEIAPRWVIVKNFSVIDLLDNIDLFLIEVDQLLYLLVMLDFVYSLSRLSFHRVAGFLALIKILTKWLCLYLLHFIQTWWWTLITYLNEKPLNLFLSLCIAKLFLHHLFFHYCNFFLQVVILLFESLCVGI